MSNLKNELQAKKETGVEKKGKPKTMLEMINVMQPQIAKALPSVITPERFTRMVMTAVSSNPQLGTCSFESFCGAMLQSAQLGLEPNTPRPGVLNSTQKRQKRNYRVSIPAGLPGNVCACI